MTSPESPLIPARARTAFELVVIAALAALYLHLWPSRPIGIDAGMALVGLGLVRTFGWSTSRRAWSGTTGLASVAVKPAVRVGLLWFTLPLLVLFGVLGAWDAYSVNRQWEDIPLRLFAPRVVLMLLLYLPWALVQQTLFQFYLFARLRVLLPAVPALSVNALLFGAAHWPEWDVMALTVGAGVLWSYMYQRDRALIPVSLSHAVLGTAYFSWVRHRLPAHILWLVLEPSSGIP